MITEVSPSARVTLNGSGAGQVAIGPPSGTKWWLRLVSVLTSTAVSQPQCLLYRGSPSGPLQLIDSTYTGASASSALVAGAPFFPGQLLWAVWTGGDAGAIATLQAYGQQGLIRDPFDAAPPVGAGFADPVVAGTTLVRQAIRSPNYVPGVSGWSINQDGTVEFDSSVIRGDLKVVGSDGDYIWLTLAGTAPTIPEILFRVVVPTFTTGAGILQAYFNGSGGASQPYVTLVSPAILPSNAESRIEINSDSSDSSIPGSIKLQTDNPAGTITLNTGTVAATRALTVSGQAITGNAKYSIGAAVADNTNSATYVDKTGSAGTPTSISFTKKFDNTVTTLNITVWLTAFAPAVAATIGVGVSVAGTDFDVFAQQFNVANTRYMCAACLHLTSSIPNAGTFTVKLRWKQSLGGANTVNTNTGDWLSWKIEEVAL